MVLVPRYIHDFKCIGSDCEANCCEAGWYINIDKKTYKKYQKIRGELVPSLKKYIKRNRSTPSDHFYADIQLKQCGTCPFLTENKLCSIQNQLGTEFLSLTCLTYPRESNLVNGIVEKSLTMACPEAARVALLNPELMEFVEDEELTKERNSFRRNINTNNTSGSNELEHYFWELRVFTIQVLQNRLYSLADRLIILGMFYQKAQSYVNEGRTKELPSLIDSYMSLITDGAFDTTLQELPTQYKIQIQFLKALVDIRYDVGISSNRYAECLNEFFLGLGYVEGQIEENKATLNYKNAYSNYYEPFMNDREYILENYMVNYVFRKTFPLSGEDKLFDNFVKLVLHYALIKLHLVGLASFHKGLTVDIVIKLISTIAEVVEHNTIYVKRVMKILKENNYTSMAYMSILIKN